MKKIKKIILTLLVMSFLANPMCLILRVHAANEEIAISRISDTLQSVMQSSEEETIEVMIWLEDINTSQAVLSSTESILSAAKATLSPRALCENPETDAEIYEQYMDARKEAKRNCLEIYNSNFADAYLYSYEVIYISKYAPIVIADLTCNRINDIVRNNLVLQVDYYNDEVVSDSKIESVLALAECNNNLRNNDQPIGTPVPNVGICYDIIDIIDYFGITELRSFVGGLGSGINIGILEESYMKVYGEYLSYLINNNLINFEEHYPTSYDQSDNAGSHPTNILEILYTILPSANYFFASCNYRIEGYTLCGEIEWLLEKDVDVISCSVSLRWDDNSTPAESYGDYGIVSQYIDYIVNEYNVTFVKSAGQYVSGLSMGAMAYNAIVVGNYDLANDIVDAGSNYYTGYEFSNKPDICAPGFFNFDSTSLSLCGNSFSTPIVAAVAALIIDYYDSMIYHGNVKSIVCASTQLHRYTTDTINRMKYGTGVLDANNIRQILMNDSSLYNNIGDIVIERTHTVYLSQGISDYIDIVLVFECNNGETSVYDIANLNLTVYDANGDLVAFSMSSNSNIEVIRNLSTVGGYYTIVVEQYYPAMYDGASQITYYSLAWCYK